MQRKIKELIEQIAKEEDLPKVTVKEIVSWPWQYMRREIMKISIREIPEEQLPVFKHMFIGQFRFSYKKVKSLKKTKFIKKTRDEK